jgi:tol-pal system protein YbgF
MHLLSISKAVRGLAAAAFFIHAGAHAGLFSDDEARKAILDLRKRLEAAELGAQARDAEINTQLTEQLAQLRKSLLDLSGQIELIRGDMARLRGQGEQGERDVAEIRARLKEVQQGLAERVQKLEPVLVTLDGVQFMAEPEEKRAYDEAMAQYLRGEFASATSAFQGFQKRFPASGYGIAASFWLGNSLYGKGEFREAVAVFRSLLAKAPEGPRSAEALLSIAQCQAQLKEIRAARKTLEDLVRIYPNTDAAIKAKEQLAKMGA